MATKSNGRHVDIAFLASLALPLVAALAVDTLAAGSSRWRWTPSPEEQARFLALQIVAAVYVFVLGATLGSFLNVVIYRLPRGMNIARPRSRCPQCASPIALRDNIPVLGWLLLRGQCRICGGPISPRYPLVEAAVGGVLLLLFWLEVRLGGLNLPNWNGAPLDYTVLVSWHIPWRGALMALFHGWLLITLLVMALIQWDGHPIPRSILALAFAVGVVLPLAFPWLRPVPGWSWAVSPEDRTFWHAAVDGLLGFTLGAFFGGLVGLVLPHAATARYIIPAGGLMGLFLGWQAALVICLAIFLPAAATRILDGKIPPLAWPALAAWLFVPSWAWIHRAISPLLLRLFG